MIRLYRIGLWGVVFFALGHQHSTAQEIVLSKEVPSVLNVVSLYKPSIIDHAKLAFVPPVIDADSTYQYLEDTTLKTNPTDTTHFRLNYADVQVFPLRFNAPLHNMGNINYIGLGYGDRVNQVPLVDIHLKFNQNIKTQFETVLTHEAFKGNLRFQEYMKTHIANSLTIKSKKHLMYVSTIGQRNEFLKYGLNPYQDTLVTQSDLKNTHTMGGINIEYVRQNQGVKWTPSIGFLYHDFNQRIQEMSGTASLNMFHYLSNPYQQFHSFFIDNTVSCTYDVATLKNQPRNIENALFKMNTKAVYENSKMGHIFGIKGFYSKALNVYIIPQFEGYFHLYNNAINLKYGYDATANNNNLNRYLSINPFISDSSLRYNTHLSQGVYVHFSGHHRHTFFYILQVNYQFLKNFVLFKNDIHDSKTYKPVVINKMNNTELMLDVRLQKSIVELHLNAIKNFYHRYDFDSLWGLPDYEITLASKVNITQKLKWTISSKMLSDNWYLLNTKINNELTTIECATAMYWNVTSRVDYHLNKRWVLWLQGTNLLNRKNDRWGGYRDLPLNVTLGVKYNVMLQRQP